MRISVDGELTTIEGGLTARTMFNTETSIMGGGTGKTPLKVALGESSP